MINGLPYYKSTGTNSNSEGTWFPCCGISRNVGNIIKPHGSKIAPEIQQQFISHLGENASADEHNLIINEFGRFGSTDSILISSVLGGGYWDTPNGQKNKRYLEEQYPDFYANSSEYEIQLTDIVLNLNSDGDRQKINVWLEEKVGSCSEEYFTGIFGTVSEYDKPVGEVASIINAIQDTNTDQTVLDRLRSAEIDIQKTYCCETIYQIAVRCKRTDVIKILLDKANDVYSLLPKSVFEAENKLILNELKNIIYNTQDVEFVKKLLDKGFHPDTNDIIKLIKAGNTEVLFLCMDKTSKEVLDGNSMRGNPLREAIIIGNIQAVQKLIEMGANPNPQTVILGKKRKASLCDQDLNTFDLAIKHGFPDIAELLRISMNTSTNSQEARRESVTPNPNVTVHFRRQSEEIRLNEIQATSDKDKKDDASAALTGGQQQLS